MRLEQSEMYQWLKALGLLETPKGGQQKAVVADAPIRGSHFHVAEIVDRLRDASRSVRLWHPASKGKFFVDIGMNAAEPVLKGQSDWANFNSSTDVVAWVYPGGHPFTTHYDPTSDGDYDGPGYN